MPSSVTNLQFGLFFDGTGNNYEVDRLTPNDEYEPTNIAKLFELYNETPDKGIGKHYINGVGTGGVNLRKQGDDADYSNIEMAFGLGIQKRVDQALAKLKAFAKANKNIQNLNIDVFGFSRGAATARIFVNQLNQKFNEDNNLLSGVKPQVRFLGIYDTVGSIGISGDGSNAGYNLNINPKAVVNACHLTAHNEFRKHFPLSSLRAANGSLAENFVEKALLGAHSDVGGGYGPNATKIYLDSSFIKFGGNPARKEAQKQSRITALEEKWQAKWQDYLNGKTKPSDQFEFKQRRAQKIGPDGQPNSHKMLVRYIWNRNVKKTLAHVGLHTMVKQAKACQVPLKGLASLAQVEPALAYLVPAPLKDYISAVDNGDDLFDGRFDSIYPNFIHHSSQFKIPEGGVGLVNANSIGTSQRKTFSNAPSKGNLIG